MKRLQKILTASLLILMLGLAMAMMVLVATEMQPVQADMADQPAVITADKGDIEYLPLTDAPPLRDITKQRFAPLEETP